MQIRYVYYPSIVTQNNILDSSNPNIHIKSSLNWGVTET